MTFEELYRTMLKQAVEKGSVQADDLEASAGHLDCLLHPQDHPLVWPLNPCTCPKEETHCAAACLFDAIVRRDDGARLPWTRTAAPDAAPVSRPASLET